MTNDFDIVEVSSVENLVKKYGETFKNLDKYLIWEDGKYPISEMQGIMLKRCLEEEISD